MTATKKEPRQAFCFVDKSHDGAIAHLLAKTVGIACTKSDYGTWDLPADATKAEQKRAQDLLIGYGAAVKK